MKIFIALKVSVVIIILGGQVKAQNNNSLNIGIGTGPSISLPVLYSLDGTGYESLRLRPRVNYHGFINVQYLIKDKFGIETGIHISNKDFYIKSKKQTTGSSLAGNSITVNLDAFYFPFLFVLKTLPFTDPFKYLNFLLGISVEYQNFIRGGPVKADRNGSSRTYNITGGARLSFKKGVLGRVELGTSLNYSLGRPYIFSNLDNSQNFEATFQPLVHFINLDLVYFFSNKHL